MKERIKTFNVIEYEEKDYILYNWLSYQIKIELRLRGLYIFKYLDTTKNEKRKTDIEIEELTIKLSLLKKIHYEELLTNKKRQLRKIISTTKKLE